MAAHVAPASQHLLDLLGAGLGLIVDVGVGTGTGIEPARRCGWDPVGVDLSAAQLDHARATGGAVVLGDAQALPIADRSSRAAISNFGLVFAADPEQVLREVRRVLVPGGSVAFTAWRPGGWPGPCRDLLADALGLPPAVFPTELGAEEAARRALRRVGLRPDVVEAGTLRWHFDGADDAVDTLTQAAGGLRLLRARAEARGVWPEARRRLVAEISLRCRRRDDGLVLEDHYLAVVGSRLDAA